MTLPIFYLYCHLNRHVFLQHTEGSSGRCAGEASHLTGQEKAHGTGQPGLIRSLLSEDSSAINSKDAVSVSLIEIMVQLGWMARLKYRMAEQHYIGQGQATTSA